MSNLFLPQKTTLSALEHKQSFSLDEKVSHSLKRIEEFYGHVDGRVYVSFSGGVDSVVLLDLVRRVFPDVVAVFSDTTNEFPEILFFIKTIPNVVTVRPKMSFSEVISKYGFPLVSKKVARSVSDLRKPTDNNSAIRNLYLTGFNRAGNYCASYKLAKKWLPLISAPFDITSKCCDILKKEPLQKFERKSKLYPFVGTMANDSNLRLLNYLQHGCNVYSDHRLVSRPLSIWTKQDVWDYIHLHNLSYSSIYDFKVLANGCVVDGEHNTGCQYCAFGAHFDKERFHRLSLRRPKQYEAMMKKTNNGVSFKEALSFVGVFKK